MNRIVSGLRLLLASLLSGILATGLILGNPALLYLLFLLPVALATAGLLACCLGPAARALAAVSLIGPLGAFCFTAAARGSAGMLFPLVEPVVDMADGVNNFEQLCLVAVLLGFLLGMIYLIVLCRAMQRKDLSWQGIRILLATPAAGLLLAAAPHDFAWAAPVFFGVLIGTVFATATWLWRIQSATKTAPVEW